MHHTRTNAGPLARALMEAALAQWEAEGGAPRLALQDQAAPVEPASGGGYDLYVWRGGYWCFLKGAPLGFREGCADGEARPADAPWFRCAFDRMPTRLFGTMQ